MSNFLIKFAISQSSSYPIAQLVEPVPDLIHEKIMEVPGIEPTTLWLVVTHADP